MKIKILESCVILTMVYGVQKWALTKGQEKKLQVVQRSMKRVILGVSKRDRIKNNYSRKRTGEKDIIYTIQKLKVKYAGHVARQCETRWPRKMME